jgi:hypothetical protein
LNNRGSVSPFHLNENKESPMEFAVGFKLKEKSGHVTVDAEDALVAALKVKMERPEALIMYVRRQNKRGDARHPARGSDSKND